MENNRQTQNVPNLISIIIKWLCWFIIIIGCGVGISNYSLNENLSQLIITCLISFGSTLGGFALAEIIQLLQDIKDRLEPNKQNNKQKYQKEDKTEKQNTQHKYTSDEIDNFLRD